MYYNDNHNCTNILLICMLFNILIMIGDRGSNNGQGKSKRRRNGKLLVHVTFFNCTTWENKRLTDICF